MGQRWTKHHDDEYELSKEDEQSLRVFPPQGQATTATLVGDGIDPDAQSLRGQLLLAMPSLSDRTFGGSVVYLVEHGPSGAMGIVLSRPADLALGQLFAKLDLGLPQAHLAEQPVLQGGPVHPDRGFVLHEPSEPWGSSIRVPDGLSLTSSRDVLEAVARGGGPQDFRVALGYAGWDSGQLEQEIAANAWLSIPLADPMVIFSIPAENLYTQALGWLGIDPLQLSGVAGHA